MKQKELRSATISDVALEAGVNKISVSVVLNGARSSTRVSAANRTKILEAAAKLQYQPNASARSLALGRTNMLGVLFGSFPVASSPIREVYGSTILQGITDESGRRDFDIVLFTKPWVSLSPGDIAKFRNQRVDGIVVVAPQIDAGTVESLVGMGVRTVAISAPSPTEDWDSVDVDNYAGSRMAVEHLISLGHRRIAHLMGTPTVSSAIERRDGYLDALRDAGIAPMPELLVQGQSYLTPTSVDGSFNGERAAEDTCQLLRLPNPPTALFAGNDIMAAEALRGARSIGCDVPGQLSIVGFDDRHFVSLLDPPLTTIRQPMLRIGEAAAALLIDRVMKESQNRGDAAETSGMWKSSTVRIAPELVVRGSTAPAPSR